MADTKEKKKVAIDLLSSVDQSIIYIGDDISYWNTIKARIPKSAKDLTFRFVHLSFRMNMSVEQMFIRVIRENPKVIYIDFSTDLEKMRRLAKYIHDETITGSIPKVGIIDSRSLMNLSRMSGMDFTHFKGGEYYDVVYDPLEVSYREKIAQPEFATATFSMESHLIDDMNVIYYTALGARIEGNIHLDIGQTIELKDAIPRERIPSRRYFLKKVGAHDIESDSRYYYDVDFTFADEPVFNNDELEQAKEIKNKTQRIQTIKLIKSDRQEQLDRYNLRIQKAKADQKEWIINNSTLDNIFRTKVLIIDFAMSIYRGDSSDMFDEDSLSIRCQTDFSKGMDEIFLSRPSIIAIQLLGSGCVENFIINTGEPEATKEPRALSDGELELRNEVMENEQFAKREQIESLVRRIKDTTNYKPFIIVFNSNKFDSKGLQQEYSYPLMMSNAEKINFKTIKNLADIYQKKALEKQDEDLKRKAEILLKTGKVKEVDYKELIERRYYPKKGTPESVVSYGVPITITTMTETEIIFHTQAELDLLQTFRIEHPLSMSLTIVKSKNGNIVENNSGFNQYRGLINSVDEIDKKYIRQYVNEIIFSPVKEERNKEKSAFKELNEKFAKLKADQMKEREEAAEKEK